MKLLIAIVLASAVLGCSKREDHAANSHSQHGESHKDGKHQHESPSKGASIMLTTDPASPEAGQPVKLGLMLHAADGAVVRDFEVVHEQKVHLAIVSEDFSSFSHVHPAVDSSGNLSVAYTFPAGGRYKFFADFTPSRGQPATASGSVTIRGQANPAAAPVPNAPGEIEADGLRARIAAEPRKAGTPVRIAFALRDDHGDPVAIDPYMGELGHLVFINVDTWEYVHVHPAGGAADRGSVEFESHFPAPGVYKGWGQFKKQGQVHVIPFVIKVD